MDRGAITRAEMDEKKVRGRMTVQGRPASLERLGGDPTAFAHAARRAD
jgi:hypothetical protein